MKTDHVTLRLLAVDDDVSSAELIVRVAERIKFEAFATSDSRGVMNLASALAPDVIAIDVRMPNLDADDLLELLAESRFSGQIIIVSGQDPDVLARVQQHGVELGLNRPHIMQKPIDMTALRDLLSTCRMRKAA